MLLNYSSQILFSSYSYSVCSMLHIIHKEAQNQVFVFRALDALIVVPIYLCLNSVSWFCDLILLTLHFIDAMFFLTFLTKLKITEILDIDINLSFSYKILGKMLLSICVFTFVIGWCYEWSQTPKHLEMLSGQDACIRTHLLYTEYII